MTDDLARLRAEMDQNREAMREVGAGVAAFFRGMVEGGMDLGDALQITAAYVVALAQRSTEVEVEGDEGSA